MRGGGDLRMRGDLGLKVIRNRPPAWKVRIFKLWRALGGRWPMPKEG
jgi:hypothetical protein